ncbi:hypothetical protein GCM10022214_68860 [Actinomadura miaoliensis]|uniref:Uncharacterized protein n=1 Tax=Actinomadura miaoliensis TaxID=430685 RepID=A0ABP7WSJ7_9ACTN
MLRRQQRQPRYAEIRRTERYVAHYGVHLSRMVGVAQDCPRPVSSRCRPGDADRPFEGTADRRAEDGRTE